MTAVAGVTVTHVPLRVAAATLPTSTLLGLTAEIDVGLTALLETVNLIKSHQE